VIDRVSGSGHCNAPGLAVNEKRLAARVDVLAVGTSLRGPAVAHVMIQPHLRSDTSVMIHSSSRGRFHRAEVLGREFARLIDIEVPRHARQIAPLAL